MKELNYLDITKTGQGHIKVPSATGIHPDMGVGTAQQIQTNIHESDSTPYVFRKTPYNSTRESGDIVGASVAWNQLVKSGDLSVTVQNGHKYYASINGTVTIGASTGSAISINDSTKDNVCDLTLALSPTIANYIYTLESGTAGAGIAKLREWGFFDKPYYAYNAGAIESVNVSKHKMTGLNQWDEEWEVGGISTSTGQDEPSSNTIRSKNYCKMLPETLYYFNRGASDQMVVYLYDSNFNFLRYTTSSTGGDTNAAYFRLRIKGTTYNHDVCVNINDAAKNGTYKPYTVHEYPLADITLRGILKLDGSNNLYADGDVYESDGTHKERYDDIDLGDLTFTDFGGGIFRAPFALGTTGTGNQVTTKYLPVTTYNAVINTDKTIAVIIASGTVYCFIHDSAYSDATTFNNAMDGEHMVYEKATPTTETITGYTNPQVCSPYGTEEFIDRAVAAGTRDVSIPCGHETEYPKNIVGAIEGIPLPPTANGNYKLRVSVASGVPTYSWVSE